VWKQLLSYIWRANDILDVDDKPRFRITTRQQSIFDQVINTVDGVVELRLHDPSPQEQEAADAGLQAGILEWVISLLDDQLGNQQYRSVIISSLAVLGLQEGGRWTNAEGYTPKLSAVIKLARLLVVQKAYTARQHAIKRRIERGAS
jgi:hypothetical protein